MFVTIENRVREGGGACTVSDQSIVCLMDIRDVGNTMFRISVLPYKYKNLRFSLHRGNAVVGSANFHPTQTLGRVSTASMAPGWRWAWVREMREMVFALDADTAGQQQWRPLARQAALREKRVAVLEPAAYGEHKDVSEAWEARVLAVEACPAAAAAVLAVPQHLRES